MAALWPACVYVFFWDCLRVFKAALLPVCMCVCCVWASLCVCACECVSVCACVFVCVHILHVCAYVCSAAICYHDTNMGRNLLLLA